MSKSDINRLTLFEAVSTLLSSTILGFLIGVISAYACTSLFMMIVELPVVLMLPTTLIIMMVLMSAFVILMGSYVGNWQINKKTISQILKGS
jgi:ABC-type antimicrobial peptide transport system permease subunit